MTTTIVMPTSLRQASEPHERTEGRGSWVWRVLAVVGPVATIILYWYIAQSAIAPRTGYDENHLLQMARLISGDDNVTQLAGSGYYPGWAVVLAPIWWFTHDAATVYAAALTVSNVIGVATIVPLALLGRRLRLTWPQSITISSIVMILPARSAFAEYALSEQAIAFFVAWVVLAAFALWQRPSWWRVVLFVAAIGAAYVTHPRTIALVATAGIWLLGFALRRWRLALLGLALLFCAYVAADRFAQYVAERVLLNGYGKDATLQNTLDNFDASIFLKVFLNQTWVQVVGTAGLFAVGSVVVVVWTIRELRERRLGTGTFMFGMILSAVLVSAIWWTRPDVLLRVVGWVRLDAWTYSRYIDPVAAIVVLVALAALVRGLRWSVVATAVGVFAAGAAAVVLGVARNVPLWGWYSASNPAILPWRFLFPDAPFVLPLTPTFTNDARFWVWATTFVFVCLGAYVVLRNRPRTLATCLLALSCALALLANPNMTRPYPANTTGAVEQIESVALGPDRARIDFDIACRAPGRSDAINWLPFWLSPRVVEIVDRRVGERFESDLVVSCEDWPEADAFGARAYDADPDYNYSLWVLPGELQTELDDAGLLK
ncbi:MULTISPECIES: hypothetical protein [unclassified Microbacterium]|uniref:hypothetical protein n=1 Tax=unclassified Microbacterium TaxID=2609290 RepID=UPI00097E8696|nr:hypothetical protein [Microbacterium sp. JB110]RCS61491.1 hypothetical protein CIK77_08300 [Microbacterium sp. JB110]SJM65823.1 hypothetical protein CZ774_13935 [Frigoribacterium sp. JB110]